ncbi:MAG: IPT/TIG domain-containing protein [Acidobacteriia bacterium]|nr:IPT/TIG domain-containing protein [Terriglobia bacterium]
MRTLQTILLAGVIASTLACGYGSHSSTPAKPGTVPAITQLSPPNTIAGGQAFMLTIDGTNFSGGAQVKWNGSVRTTVSMGANQLVAMISAADIATAGTVQVTVTNPGTPGGPYGGGTQSETSAPMDFTIN